MIKKAVLTRIINKSVNIPLREASACVDAVLETLSDALSKGERIELRGFGSFTIRNIPQKKYPSSLKGDILIPAHKKILFRPSQSLKTKLRRVDGKNNKIQTN